MALTTFLGLDKLATGQASKDPTLNGDLDALDGVIAGINSKNFSGATTTQTLITSEARKMRHVFTNAGAAIDVKFPLLYSANFFIVYNNSGFTLTIKTDAGGSTGIAVANGYTQALWINGDNVQPVGSATSAAGGMVGCRVYGSANQSINNATVTALSFNTERYDTDVIHDNSTNPTRLTCKTAGKYSLKGMIGWAANATGFRAVYIRINGTLYIAAFRANSTGATDANYMTIATDYDLAVNDYAELCVEQNSGGALNVIVNGNSSYEFAMHLIR